MSLQRDLLDQARQLARHEPRRPRQASLRRAVSAAYYALFHLLADAASREVVSGGRTAALRMRVRRALPHSDMHRICRSLASWDPNQPPLALADFLPAGPSPDLRTVAAAFVELQQARHEADYDLSRNFTRKDTLDLLQVAETAFSAFDRFPRSSDERRLFLVGLFFHTRWGRG